MKRKEKDSEGEVDVCKERKWRTEENVRKRKLRRK